MNKKLLSFIVLVLFFSNLFSSPVALDVAKTIAVKWYKHYAPANTSDFSIKEYYVADYNGATTYYTFVFRAGGFVMVAADDISFPLLGYSFESDFNKNNIPVNAVAFFDNYSKEIWQMVNAKLDNKETRREWDNILNNVYAKDVNAVTPICTTTWDQTSPYSNLCPQQVYTGCVATAMAQIMKKWNWPTTGQGSHSYVHANFGTLSANFGTTTYNWTGMLDSYAGSSTSAQRTAVATLMYHCGVAVNMNYDAAGSGAYSQDVPDALINYFSYQPTAECKYKAMFTYANWLIILKAELNAGRPFYLAGDDNATAGHAFVADGFNNANQFHINWGWGGSSNGYFLLTTLNPSGYNFSSNNVAVIRIRPFANNVPIASFIASSTTPPVGSAVTFTDQSLNNPTTWAWTFEGGVPSTANTQVPPTVTFAGAGYKMITLTVSNANGSDIKVMERYVKVGGVPSAWIKQNTGFAAANRGVDQICIVDQNVVWARAYDGANPTGYIREFTRTNNGGTTWTPGSINITGAANWGVSNIFAQSYTNAFACLFPISGTGGKIIKTIDGGANWTEQTTAPFTNSWADFVHFFDANNGVCMGDPTVPTAASDFVIYTTSTGGATWTQVSTSSLPNSLVSEAGIVNLYDAVGNTIWFTTNKGRVFKSLDKGLSWNVYSTGFSNVFTMKFKDANNGIAVLDTLPYTMKKTFDGGLTWNTITPTGYYVKYPRVAFVPGTSSTWVDVASSPNQGSSYSLNDCVSFLNVDTGSVQYTSIAFFDINTGWAGSYNTSAVDGGIYKWNPSVMTEANQIVYKDFDFKLYPVPAKNILNIQLGTVENENITVSIYNMIGQCIYSKNEKAAANEIIGIDVVNKDSGVYFVNILNGGKTITKKFTIVK